jgi:hypothetical protein
MLENGSKTRKLEMDIRSSQMAVSIEECLLMEYLTELGVSGGHHLESKGTGTKVSGEMAKCMERENFIILKATF